jgi:hypothetical protein
MCAQRIGWGEGKGGRPGGQGRPTGKAVYSFVSAPATDGARELAWTSLFLSSLSLSHPVFSLLLREREQWSITLSAAVFSWSFTPSLASSAVRGSWIGLLITLAFVCRN